MKVVDNNCGIWNHLYRLLISIQSANFQASQDVHSLTRVLLLSYMPECDQLVKTGPPQVAFPDSKSRNPRIRLTDAQFFRKRGAHS
uniref:Uncharacterized protein n=1 Tax=Nelumbo nucifera TaxID=4432 RepID=A0A822Y5P0_NELNU|nr:TPA_asm: hypothetical protein HUJ06_029245 [Nelumbo nucifera]